MQREGWGGKACNIANDPTAFYRYERKKMMTIDSVGPLINDNGDVIRDSPCFSIHSKQVL